MILLYSWGDSGSWKPTRPRRFDSLAVALCVALEVKHKLWKLTGTFGKRISVSLFLE